MNYGLFVVPLRVRFCHPLALGTDSEKMCRGIDGCDYVIKDGTGGGGPFTPHSEWFCAHLSEIVEIASPTCRVIEMPDKSLGHELIKGIPTGIET